MNKVILMGRLVREPEVIYSNNGNAVSKFTLAVPRKFVGKDNVDTDFIQCVAFGKTAEFTEKYFQKGVLYSVYGRMVTREYDDKDGVHRWITEVAVEECYFCEKRRDDTEQEQEVTRKGYKKNNRR